MRKGGEINPFPIPFVIWDDRLGLARAGTGTGLLRVSPGGSRDPSRDPGLGERKGKKKRKVLERSCFRLPKRGERGEKAFSIDEYFFYSSAIRELFFRGRKNSNEILDVKRRLWTRLEWKELIFFYGNFNTMFYTGKRCLITIKYSECVTNLAPHLYNRGNYY